METKSYLVTGASTGIGRACVDELVAAGARVWAAVRSDRDEEALRRAHPAAVSPLRLDLTDQASIEAAGARVRAAGPLHGLVNNAGVAEPAPLEHIPIDVFRRQIDINLTGQLAITQAVLPALRHAADEGQDARIVMVGSIAGRIAGPLRGPYHASKFGLVGLADTLRAELAPWGIAVVLIEPGAVATTIWKRGGAAAEKLRARLPAEGERRYAAQFAASSAFAQRQVAHAMPPRRVAEVIGKALTARHPRPRYLVGVDARATSVVARLPYRLRYRLMAAKQP